MRASLRAARAETQYAFAALYGCFLRGSLDFTGKGGRCSVTVR